MPHVYTDEDARRTLPNCRDAMESANRLLVIEAVVPTTIRVGNSDMEKMLMSDLNMLMTTGARERNESEWRSSLSSAGFETSRILAVSGSTASIIESVP